MELMITGIHCNALGDILYKMINQGLCFPILLTEIKMVKEPSWCYCVCVCVCLCGVCVWSGEKELERNVLATG